MALALCKRLEAMGCPLMDSDSQARLDGFPTALEEASAAGNADVCAWLLAGGRPRSKWSWGALYAAARGGHAGLVLWLQSQPQMRSSKDTVGDFSVRKLLKAAAHGCTLPDLQRIYQEWLGRRLPQPQIDEMETFGPRYVERRPDGLICNLESSAFSQLLEAAAGSPTPCWLDKITSLMRWHCGADGEQLLGSCGEALSRIFGGAMTAPDGVDRVQRLWERGWRPDDELAASVRAAAGRCDAAAVRYLTDELGANVPMDSRFYWSPYPPLTGPVQAGDPAFLQLMLRTYRVGCSGKRFYYLLQSAAEAGHASIIDCLLAWEAEPEQRQAQDLRPGVYLKAGLQEGLRLAVRNGHAAAVRCLLGHGARLERGPPWWLEAAKSGSVETLRVLAESGYATNGASVYEAALDAGDRWVLREMARLHFRGSDAAAGLTALLEDPDVPLSELRWLLEGDNGGDGGAGGGGGSAGASGSDGGAACGVGAGGGAAAASGAGPAGGRGRAGKRHPKQQAGRGPASGAAPCGAAGAAGEGPAAEALRYEAEWQRAVEAVRCRGRGREARNVRAWLEVWRQSQQNRMRPGCKPDYVEIE
ncbi:hypothetical protein HXX76_002194 [Chlamydomonas incerta]|uniref:Ankyrin repeat domain-containing protein n=1 Tax=Chlamydomonas incerta TaxID=51695 RepID=A0A835WAM4_CHLIN|nr:hypothetical protein HXX76_002194 [Chlamydomonas incerta]|eukprot:KAG2443851.1 hypothetical protein HXX76_002194 [Chlamydomonas incerta]